MALTEGKLSMITGEWKGRSKTHEKDANGTVMLRLLSLPLY